jgi:hypothetical protein
MSSQASSYQDPNYGPFQSLRGLSPDQRAQRWPAERAAGQESVDLDNECIRELSELNFQSQKMSQLKETLKNNLSVHAKEYPSLFPSENPKYGTIDDHDPMDMYVTLSSLETEPS